MNSNLDAKLLVTGASGQLGRKVLDILLEKGAKDVVAVTRNPEKLSSYAKKGIDVQQGDFDDEASLDKAFTGTEILLLISTDALDRPGHRAEQHLRAIASAVKAGVKHIVYTSFSSPDDSPVAIAGDHQITEKAIRESGLAYTILRNNMYMDMLPQSLGQAVASGTLYSAAGDGATAYITRDDCAYAAAGALLNADNKSATLDVTGPDALTQQQLAEIVSKITGKPVSYVPLTEEQAVEGMVKAGLPEGMAKVWVTFDLAVAAGKHEMVTNAVKDLSGKEPESVESFLKSRMSVLAPA